MMIIKQQEFNVKGLNYSIRSAVIEDAETLSKLKRLLHKVEFGVCVLKDYWGFRVGRHLLKESITWADSVGIKKMILSVLETNNTAIELYKSYGFEIEGILKQDKLLSDGIFYNTIVMGRFKED